MGFVFDYLGWSRLHTALGLAGAAIALAAATPSQAIPPNGYEGLVQVLAVNEVARYVCRPDFNSRDMDEIKDGVLTYLDNDGWPREAVWEHVEIVASNLRGDERYYDEIVCPVVKHALRAVRDRKHRTFYFDALGQEGYLLQLDMMYGRIPRKK